MKKLRPLFALALFFTAALTLLPCPPRRRTPILPAAE